MTQEDAAKFVSEYSGYETIFKNSKVYLRKIPENFTAEDFTFTPSADLTYDGNAKSATVTSTKVTEQDKIANGKKVGVSPKTGVRADYILWLSLAVLLSADVLTSVVLLKKKARSK